MGLQLRSVAALAVALVLTAGVHGVPPERLRRTLEDGISRRVARDSSGRIYLLRLEPGMECSSAPRLLVGAPGAAGLADFGPPIDLSAGPMAGDAVRAAGLAIDGRDRLHLVWTTAAGLTAYAVWDLAGGPVRAGGGWLNPIAGRPGRGILAASGSEVGDIAVSPDGEAYVTWTVQSPGHASTLYLARGSGADGRFAEPSPRIAAVQSVAEGFGYFPAALLVERAGRFHLGWTDIYEDDRLLSGVFGSDASRLRPVPVPDRAGGPRDQDDPGFRPAMAIADGRLLTVREDWINRLQSCRGERPGAALFPVLAADSRFIGDTVFDPQLSVDRYGIPWLFFIDGARETAFCTRWLGHAWGPVEAAGKITWNRPRMEDSHLPIDRIAVEERAPAGRGDLALWIENDSTTPAAAFRRIPVPGLKATPGRKIGFFDLKELADLDGLRLALNPPRKVGPILGPAPAGYPDSQRLGPPVRVLKEDGRYRLWYAGQQAPDGSDHWWEWYHSEYGESRDGRSFQRVPLGLASFHGKTETNLIPGMVQSQAVSGICRDEADPDPSRRYKFLHFPISETYSDEARAGRIDPWSERIAGQLLLSPDGIHWRAEPAWVDFPGGRPLMGFIPTSLVSDPGAPDPGRRYKAYGFSAFDKVRRCGILATSPDGRHWIFDPDNPVLDPLIGATPPVHGGVVDQIHDTMVWREGDYYLALYQYQHDSDWADIRLAMSRDGENFVFIHPETPFIPQGGPGAWDRGTLDPSPPLADADEIKFYYGAVYFTAGVESARGESRGGIGMATLRSGGYTDLELSPGRTEASLTSIPIQPDGARRLFLNADCRGGGAITAEIIDPATGQPLPGYARGDSQPWTGDATDGEVRWRAHHGFEGLNRIFQLRLYLAAGAAARPKLYTLQFR